MIKVAMIGAGSAKFARRLARDILIVPELQDTEFRLTDTHEGRLAIAEKMFERDIRENGLPAKIMASTDRREVLKDADFVIIMIRAGGIPGFTNNVEIPLKYGVDQCIGDTLGPGGIMYGQMEIPPILEFCKDIREVSKPGAIVLNYSNPNAMVTWAMLKYGKVNGVGLCHGVQHTSMQLAQLFNIPLEELDYSAGGINHMTWFTKLSHNGKNLTGKLLAAFESDEAMMEKEKVRVDILRRTGYYCTESSGFISEMTPWYRKRPEKLGDWVTLDEDHHHGETAGGLRFNTEQRQWVDYDMPHWLELPVEPITPEERTEEHASYIIEGLVTGRTYRGHFNVKNNGIIPNLAHDAIIEVPGYVDGNGISIPHYGKLPMICAAMCESNIQPQRLGVEAAVMGDAELLKQAMMMDPLTGAKLTTPEIWQMVDEMLVANEAWLPQYGKAIKEAKENLKSLPPVESNGMPPTRRNIKTLEEMIEEAEASRARAMAISTGKHHRHGMQ